MTTHRRYKMIPQNGERQNSQKIENDRPGFIGIVH